MNAAANVNAVALQAVRLNASLGGVAVLHDVDLTIYAGRWTSIVGPNGAGKSTLLKALANLLPAQGEVRLCGQNVHALGRRQRAQRLSWLGQNETVADDLRVADVVMLGRLPHQNWLAGATPEDHAVVEQALRSTQAWEWRDRSLGQLAGGERQRVLLARALAVQAEVLLMDEPLVNLDPPHQADWLALVQALVARGKTVVSVLHEITMALQADDMVIMARGRVLHQGRSSDPATHTALSAVFDHRVAVHCLQGQWLALPVQVPVPAHATPIYEHTSEHTSEHSSNL